MEDPAAYVLNDDDGNSAVTLMSLDKEEAFFCGTPSSVDVYSPKIGPFVYRNQYNEATQLLQMPFSTFINVGKAAGVPKSKVLLLSNTGNRFF